MSRRDFIAGSSLAAALLLTKADAQTPPPKPLLVDIHVHQNAAALGPVGSGPGKGQASASRQRTTEEMLAHQKNIGAVVSVLLALMRIRWRSRRMIRHILCVLPGADE